MSPFACSCQTRSAPWSLGNRSHAGFVTATSALNSGSPPDHSRLAMFLAAYRR